MRDVPWLEPRGGRGRTARAARPRRRAARAPTPWRGPSRRRRRRRSRRLLQHRVGQARPRVLRPVAELEVGEAGARDARSGSTHTNVPAAPKCPNVRDELRAPVQCGDFASRSSKPRPQSFGSMRPKLGSTPTRPGNTTASPRRASRARRASARAARGHGERVRERAAQPPGRRAGELGAEAERPQHRLVEVLAERHLGAGGDVRRPAPRSPSWSRSGAGRARRSAARRRAAGPDACASRWRTVAPGGPAGSSRSTMPSSSATSAASAVTGFVTDAQRSPRRPARAWRRGRRGVTTPAAFVRAGHASIWSEGVHAAAILGRGTAPHSGERAAGAGGRLLARGRRRRPRVRVRHRADPARRREPPTGSYEQARLCLEIVAGALERGRRHGRPTSCARASTSRPQADFDEVARAHGEVFGDDPPGHVRRSSSTRCSIRGGWSRSRPKRSAAAAARFGRGRASDTFPSR